ncbi:hypothetical protein EGH24_05050 [Halonotius terrestris]|uniref:Uncharacterized protein n=1 Tax=Halonotius terrestris TaxID=2487750 RepID=A0A8J8PAJ0_9EURY|nr:hypothetical protein [Halonotius terrestris]TQQ82810.1 hypothetical protein EGH24_05050 [Halonotius terrestris]
MSDAETPTVEYETRIEDGETIIDVTGEDQVAFVVQSASGERIYFPPEDMDAKSKAEEDSPYQGSDPYDSPYEADSPYRPAEGDSPYQPNEDEETSTRGVTETRTGFKINHPEPAHEISVFRKAEAS